MHKGILLLIEKHNIYLINLLIDKSKNKSSVKIKLIKPNNEH